MGDYIKQAQALEQASRHAAPLMLGPVPRIAVNGRFLTQKVQGVQRYAIEALHAIDALLDTDDYRALKGHIEIVAPPKARDFPLKNIPLRRAGYTGGYLWEQVEFPLHARGQFLLNFCMLGPVAVRDQLVIVHDATVKALPDNFSWRFRTAYGLLVPMLCRRAAVTTTVSEFSRGEIAALYHVNTDKMAVTSPGCDHMMSLPSDPTAIERFGLTGKKFLLGVGVSSSRNKNGEVMAAAFAQAKLDNTLLVLTGKNDAAVFGRATNIDSDTVRSVGHVSDPELRALYEHAQALVFPSRYEGFGLPPLEAMMCGCPVIISNQGALMEVCGDAALRCGMDDVTALAQLMREVTTDTALREKLAAAGRARASRFTWAAVSRRLLDYCIAAGTKRAP